MLETMPRRLLDKEDAFGSKVQRSRANAIKRLEALYTFMDDFFEHVGKYTPCQKGCSHCCHYEVCVSEHEVQYIEAKTKQKRMKQFSALRNGHGRPCPFLKNGSCSIYHARPFMCRRHVVFRRTNAGCHPDVCFLHQSIQLQLTGIEKAYAHIISNGGSPELYDIRQVFES